MWLRASLLLLALAALVAAAPKIRTKRPRGYDTRYERTEPMAGPHTWISTTGNWGATSSWDTGAVPLAAEIVYFDGLFSNHSVTSGLDQSAVALDTVWVLDSYTGNLGTPSEPIQLNTGDLLYFGQGTLYWSESGNTRTVIDSANTVEAVHFAGGTPGFVYIRGGRCFVDAKCGNFGFLAMTPSVNTPNDPSVFVAVPTSAQTIGTIIQTAGFIENNRSAPASTTWHLGGGEFVMQSGVMANTYITGGHLEYNSGTVAGTNFYLVRGTLDFNQDRRAKVLGLIEVYPGAELSTNAGITFTTWDLDIRPSIPTLP